MYVPRWVEEADENRDETEEWDIAVKKKEDCRGGELAIPDNLYFCLQGYEVVKVEYDLEA